MFTPAAHYWLTVGLAGGKVRAGAEVVPDQLARHLATWQIVGRDLPRVLRDLSVAQSATFVNAAGLTVRVWVEVPAHVFRFEEVPDENSPI